MQKGGEKKKEWRIEETGKKTVNTLENMNMLFLQIQ